MSELNFFWLARALTQNSNSMEVVKYFEKNQRLHIQIRAVTLKMTICKTMSKKKLKTQDSMDTTKFFLAPCLSFKPLGNFSQFSIYNILQKNT
jgi:hypothetical protein